MEEGRIGENLMHQRENPPPPPPRRRTENQTAVAAAAAQKCPRCESANTKFCYYNNYSLSQPRYFCKACRRYWTHGGTLRNVPVGGGCRKTKRPTPKHSPCRGEVARSLPFSAAAVAPAPLHQSRAPVMAHVAGSNSYYSGGGAFLSSLAGMQSLTTTGGGMNNIGANMALLQNLQSMKQNDQLFQSLNINPPRPGPGSWTQSFISAGPSSSNFWSRDAVGNSNNQAGSSSFFSNQWPDINNNNNNNSAGFDPSR